ncbi:MAG: hypothetical protein ABI347_08205 [Nitrososphaera sp.]
MNAPSIAIALSMNAGFPAGIAIAPTAAIAVRTYATGRTITARAGCG